MHKLFKIAIIFRNVNRCINAALYGSIYERIKYLLEL